MLSQGVTQVLKLKVWTQDFVGAVLVSYQQVNFQFCVLVVIGDEGSNNEQKKNRFVVALLYSFWKMQEKIQNFLNYGLIKLPNCCYLVKTVSILI